MDGVDTPRLSAGNSRRLRDELQPYINAAGELIGQGVREAQAPQTSTPGLRRAGRAVEGPRMGQTQGIEVARIGRLSARSWPVPGRRG